MRKVRIIALLLITVLILSACASAEEETVRKDPAQQIEWTPVYNAHQCGMQAGQMRPSGTTQRALTEEEIRSLVPGELLVSMKTTGFVYYLEENGIHSVSLQMKLQDGYAIIIMGKDARIGACCVSLGNGVNDQKTQCGEVEYYLYRQIASGGMNLSALGQVNEIPILVRIDSKQPANDKVIFENILEAFSRLKGTSLTLSEIKFN